MEYIKVRVKWFHEYDNPLVTDTRPDVQLNQDGHVTSTYCLFFLGFPGKMHSRGDDFFKITCLGACHCYSPLPAASLSSVGGGGVSTLLCKPSHSSDLDKGSVPIVGGCLPYLSVIMPCGFDRRLRWTVLWCKCMFGRIVLLTVGCICPNNELPQHSIKFLYCTGLYRGARQFFLNIRCGITGMASQACMHD